MKTVLTLASNSPRRRELLNLGGWMFHISPVDIDETPRPGENPVAYVMRMAEEKARAAQNQLRPGGIALAADTTVVHEGEILGKPANPREAADMLWRLRGTQHQVHTAIALAQHGREDLLTDCCTTNVPMRSYSDEEIFDYIASKDPFDKAGGYAIQNQDFHPVESLQGCYANVVGLPLCHLVRLLAELDIPSKPSVPKNCQQALQYPCPIYEQVLQGDA